MIVAAQNSLQFSSFWFTLANLCAISFVTFHVIRSLLPMIFTFFCVSPVFAAFYLAFASFSHCKPAATNNNMATLRWVSYIRGVSMCVFVLHLLYFSQIMTKITKLFININIFYFVYSNSSLHFRYLLVVIVQIDHTHNFSDLMFVLNSIFPACKTISILLVCSHLLGKKKLFHSLA